MSVIFKVFPRCHEPAFLTEERKAYETGSAQEETVSPLVFQEIELRMNEIIQ